MNWKFLTLICFFSLVGMSQASAQDLVYKPKNPAFGGDTFNYNWLLNSAQVQDLTEEESTTTRSTRNSLDDFTESLNRQLLSQLSRELINNQFGEDGLEEGSYTLGNYQIDVSNTIEGLVINILDSSAGEQTQVIIPYF